MFRNNYQQSEDSLGKISHSKSKNQVMMAAKLKEKVHVGRYRKVNGMTVFIYNISQSIVIKTNLIHNV